MKLVPLNSTSLTASKDSVKKDIIEMRKSPSVSDHIVAGSIALSAVALPTRYLKILSVERVKNMASQYKKHNDCYKGMIDYALEKTGLKNKGVNIRKTQELTFDAIDEICRQVEQKAGILGKIHAWNYRNRLEAWMKGSNASFSSTNVIFVNTNKSAIFTFHEMGHALNYNDKGFTRLLLKSRKLSRLVPVIMLVAAFTPAKMKDDKSKNIIDKSTTFIKNNAGKLAFVTMVPTLAEEVLASCRANKIANLISMDKQLVKNMNKFNTVAAMTYFASALASGLSAYGVSWIHDRIVPTQKR